VQAPGSFRCGLEVIGRRAAPSPEAAPCLPKVDARSEVVCRRGWGSLGCPGLSLAAPFHATGLALCRPFPLGSSQVQPPWRTSSSEFLCHDLAGAFQRRHARSGFVPHRGVTTGIHFHAKVPKPFASFRPQAFSASRRFAPPVASRACFIPQPRPGFDRPGVSPFAQRSALFGWICPLVVGTAATALSGAAADLRRLRGIAPCEDACRKGGIDALPVAPLIGVSPPPGFLPLRRRSGYPDHPLSTSFKRGFVLTSPRMKHDPSVLPAKQSAFLSARVPACSRFRAFRHLRWW